MLTANCLDYAALNSTLSDYMLTIFQDRHSGLDSHQAILPDAFRVNANLFQTDLYRNPGSMDGFELTTMTLDTRCFTAGMTNMSII
jgi:hypothetical protein